MRKHALSYLYSEILGKTLFKDFQGLPKRNSTTFKDLRSFQGYFRHRILEIKQIKILRLSGTYENPCDNRFNTIQNNAHRDANTARWL